MFLLLIVFLLYFFSDYGKTVPPSCMNSLSKTTEINSFTIMNGYVVTEESNIISIYKNVSSGNPLLSFNNPIGQRLTKMVAIENEILILCAKNTIKLCSFTMDEGKFSCDKDYVNHKSTINDIVAIPFSTVIVSCDEESVHVWNAVDLSELNKIPLANAKSLAVKNNETVYAIGEELFEISIPTKTILLADKKYYKKTFQTKTPIYSLLFKSKLYAAQNNELTEYDFEKKSENTLTFMVSNIIGNMLAYVEYQELLFYRAGEQIYFINGSIANYAFFIGFENSLTEKFLMTGFGKYLYILRNNIISEYNLSYWPVKTNEGCIPTCVLENCRNCLSAYTDICVNCAPGFKRFNGVCFYNCPYGTDSEINNDCCPEHCTECRSAICNTCETGYYLSSYGGQGICKPCPGGCSICFSENICNTCETGYFLSSNDGLGICKPCSRGCSICIDEKSCSVCNPGFTFNLNKCVANCSTNEFLNSLDNKCYKCSVPNCQACIKDNITCGTCKPGYYLSSYYCNSCKLDCMDCSSYDKCNNCFSLYTLEADGLCHLNLYSKNDSSDSSPSGGAIGGIVSGGLSFFFCICCLVRFYNKCKLRFSNRIHDTKQLDEIEMNNQSAHPLNKFEQHPLHNVQSNGIFHGEQKKKKKNPFINNPTPISTTRINDSFVQTENTKLFAKDIGQKQLILPQIVQNSQLPFVDHTARPSRQQIQEQQQNDIEQQPIDIGQQDNNQPDYGHNQDGKPLLNNQSVGFIPEEK